MTKLTMIKQFTTLLITASMVTGISAADSYSSDDSDWYISPLGSYIKSDQSRVTEDSGKNFHIGLGKEISDKISLELGVDVNRFDRSNVSNLTQLGLELDALYFFNRDNAISPYFATGIGVMNTNTTQDTNPVWSAGLGLMSDIAFLDQAKLRTEVRFQQEYDTSNYVHDDVLLRAGLQIPFGEKAPKPAPKPIDKDSDNDGVLDANDKCPATPAGTKVNSYGCEMDSDNDGIIDSKDQCPNTPSGTKVDSKGCKVVMDSDGDGVNDSADQCPNTPAGTAVNSSGCPVDGDDDNDGVPNSKDQCANSAQGVRIDFKGCEIKEVISLPGINFESNSSQLTSSSAATLDGAAATLNKYSDITAEVAGHTDSTGKDSYNEWLSGKRAESVSLYLIAKGVAASRLSSKGYGEAQPIADNSNKEGRARNRRVELNVAQ